jgi:hypothetical protein
MVSEQKNRAKILDWGIVKKEFVNGKTAEEIESLVKKHVEAGAKAFKSEAQSGAKHPLLQSPVVSAESRIN